MMSMLADAPTRTEPDVPWSPETSTEASPEAQRPTRHERIAAAAYRLAEQRGFSPGAELDDWLQAEREIDADDARQD